jgi:hypothetical protein
MLSATTLLIEEADRLVARAMVRVSHYRHHVEELRRSGGKSEGAEHVLSRMQASLEKLRLYREMLCRDERTSSAERG